MEYKTPGVYIREVDSGPKPIESVATAVPGFLGMFPFSPPSDATAVTGSDGARELAGKVAPQLVDASGKINPEHAEEAGTALTSAFRFKPRNVKDVAKLLDLNGHKVKFGPGSKGRVKISDAARADVAVEVAEVVMSADGKVITDDDQTVEDLLNTIHTTFALDKPKPRHAKDLLQVYGYNFKSSEASALNSEYSIPPVAVTNKSAAHADQPHARPRRPGAGRAGHYCLLRAIALRRSQHGHY